MTARYRCNRCGKMMESYNISSHADSHTIVTFDWEDKKDAS